MKPGATTSPLTSTVSRAAGTAVLTDTMRPALMPTARTASRFVSGSSTRPPTSTMSRGADCADTWCGAKTIWPKATSTSARLADTDGVEEARVADLGGVLRELDIDPCNDVTERTLLERPSCSLC